VITPPYDVTTHHLVAGLAHRRKVVDVRDQHGGALAFVEPCLSSQAAPVRPCDACACAIWRITEGGRTAPTQSGLVFGPEAAKATSGQPLYQPQPKWLELWKIHGDGWPPADEIGVCYSCYRFLHKTYNRWMRYCCSCTQATPRLAREFRAKPGSGGGEWCGACRRDAERKEQQAKSKPVPVGEPPPLPRFSCARNTSFKVCYDDDCNHVEGDDDGPEHRHLSDFARSYTLENTRHRIESYNRTSCGQQLQGGGRCDGTMRVEEGTDGRSLDQQLVLVCQRCKHREIERNQLPLKVDPHAVMGDSSDVPHHTSTQVPTYPNTHHVKHSGEKEQQRLRHSGRANLQMAAAFERNGVDVTCGFQALGEGLGWSVADDFCSKPLLKRVFQSRTVAILSYCF
jgi:hypothetical protein